MRILAVTPRAYLGGIFLSLLREGHDVRVAATEPRDHHACIGLLPFVPDWRAELSWVGRDGIILFEGIGRGAEQDALRREGYRVVGGSAIGDRLETDRGYGQSVLAELGLPIAKARRFDTAVEAEAFLRRNPARSVIKYDGGEHATFVGDHPAGLDAAYMLREQGGGPVLLSERLGGVEVGVGAYFDGRQFLRPACIDFEHKRFFPGDMGEMTGEMGTLASYEGADRLFEATLNRVAPMLAATGHVGYVNLNLMVDERGPVPLEFTCRIGNPGYAVLAALQRDGWGDLLARMAAGEGGGFATLPGWSVAIVLSVPPFPHALDYPPGAADPPLFWLEQPDAVEQPHYHPVDVRVEGNEWLIRRRSGHAMIVTGTGETPAAARSAANHRAANVIAPEMRWRADIGDRYARHDKARLQALGWL